MNTLEAPAPNQITRSIVSDWVGDPVLRSETDLDALNLEDKVTFDTHQLTERMFDLLDAYDPGPISLTATVDFYRPLKLLLGRVLLPLLKTYAAVAYDSIDLTFSVSDPKCLVGGLHVGCTPYTAWQRYASEVSLKDLWNLSPQMRSNLLLSPNVTAIYYGESADVKMNIPWQFNTAYLNRDDLYRIESHVRQMVVGEPLVFVVPMDSYYVTDIANPPVLRIFTKFNNLRYANPSYLESFDFQMGTIETDFQSGLEPLMVGLAVETAIAAGVEVVSNLAGTPTVEETGESKSGTYEEPTSVSLSYIGDSTSMSPPQVTPTFSTFSGSPSRHQIIEFLKRPQFVGTFNASAIAHALYANPMDPLLNAAGLGNDVVTYFNWFGQCAQYWRGTLVFDVVIMGHPLVEVAYNFSLAYPQTEDYFNASGQFSEAGTLSGICKGVTRIRIPMPYGTKYDQTPLMDTFVGNLDKIRYTIPSVCFFTFHVLSTMLNVVPIIPAAVYVSALDDFTFSWPRPPGLFGTSQVIPRPLTDRSALIEKSIAENGYVDDLTELQIGEYAVETDFQIGIPVDPILFETRAKTQAPSPNFHPIVYVEDFFRYWCRCLPYNTVDGTNDEPEPKIQVASYPSFISSDEAATWTLNVNNSWYVCQDYMSLFSAHFMYFKGSIGMKIVMIPDLPDTAPYRYVALKPPGGRTDVHNPFTISSLYVPENANFGVGAVITPSSKQPLLEYTHPYTHPIEWYPTFYRNTVVSSRNVDDVFHQYSIDSNVVLQEPLGDLLDSLCRKAGADYALAIETTVPPSTLWLHRGATA